MEERPLKVLYVAAEAVPFAKVGGLADVAGSLPRALRNLGHDVRLMIPRYGTIRSDQFVLKPVKAAIPVPVGPGTEFVDLLSTTDENLPAYLIWNEAYFSSRDRVYGFEDDAQRFVLFGRAALAALEHMDWQPDVIHANDWHTGIVPAWLNTDGRRFTPYRDIASLFTIHNLAYQGITGRLILTFAQMDYLKHLQVEQPGTVNWLAQGIAYADMINTVSPTYAREILAPGLGMGLDSLLRERQDRLVGVLNGIDTEEWDPARDPHIPHRFTADRLDQRAANKTLLQQQARLPALLDAPLIGMVTRLDQIKGIDLLQPVLERVLSDPALEAQFVLLGVGQPEYHAMLESLASRYPQKMRAFLKFDDVLARRIYAGADIFLMPSAVEPCGLGQMIAMRYGCVPVVRATGGLADTVVDHDAHPGQGTGFTFAEYSAPACWEALMRALRTYGDRSAWRGLQRRGMAADFSWAASARQYVELYRRAIALHGG
jgi:starch synthase